MSDSKRLLDTAFQPGLIEAIAADAPEMAKLNTCIQCGSCSGGCVAADGMGMTPRQIWRAVQLGMADDVLAADNAWNCTTCALCEKRCPRGIPLGGIIVRLREMQAAQNGLSAKAELAVGTLAASRNITGDPQQNRRLWIENMGLTADQAAGLFRPRADVVYFTGCVSSLFPQAYKIPQTLSSLLLKTGADFSLLEDEWCCGYPLLANGQGLEAIRDYAGHNVDEIVRKGASTILVSCPTCYYMFKKVYPKILPDMPEFKILHYSEYLAGQLAKLDSGLVGDDLTVTYHDPCDLGRKLHITSQPRDLLQSLPGVKLKEMRFNGEEGKCCGGGGNLEMNNPELSESIARKRVDDALATGAAALVTCCQQCKRTLQNAVRKSRARIKVYDMLEFIETRIKTADGGTGK